MFTSIASIFFLDVITSVTSLSPNSKIFVIMRASPSMIAPCSCPSLTMFMISSSYSLSSSSSCSCSDVCSFFFASLIFSLCFMKKHPTANPMITAKMIIISTEGVNPSISFSFSFYLLEIKTIQT